MFTFQLPGPLKQEMGNTLHAAAQMRHFRYSRCPVENKTYIRKQIKAQTLIVSFNIK